MKNLNFLNVVSLVLALAAGSAQAQFFGSMGSAESDSHTVLVVKPDGSCVLTNDGAQPRKTLEMQLTSWERYSKMSEGTAPDDEDAATPAPPPSKPAGKTLSNEELAAKLREMYEQRPDNGDESGLKVEAVEVSSNSVRVVTSRSFASLKELLGQSPYTWGPSLLMAEEARVEIDTNGNLRLTLSPGQAAARYAKTASRGWKSAKMNYDWKLVLPGKILTSSLPNTEGTATWLSLDGEKPDTAQAALKLIGSPVVITAEAGGIKLDEPLESKKLVMNTWRQRKAEPDIPVTDATPGFVAEPVSIRLATVHCFPEAEKYLKDQSAAYMYGLGSTGTVISAKLFPPKGREIKSISGLKVKAAKDDQGRPIPGIGADADGDESMTEFRSFNSGDSGKPQPARFDLRLSLPAPDAKSIDELEAEGVALTIGGWKEMVLTNVQADTNKEIDLSEVLAGAKLTIKKVSKKKPQQSVQATLQGPKEVSQLEVKIKLASRRGGQSNMNEQRSSTVAGLTKRNVTIQAYEFDPDQEANSAPLTLLVRYPQDVKRERVHFKLTALDLL